MKLIYILGLIGLISFAGCNKKTENAPHAQNGDELNLSESFDWKMSRVVNFNLTNDVETVVQIASVDNKHIYYNGNHPGDGEEMEIAISVPNTVNTLLVNGQEVELSSDENTINSIQNLNVAGPKLEDISGDRGVDLVNWAARFNVGTSRINMGDITQLNNVANFTVEGWARQMSNMATAYIFSKEASGDHDIVVRTDGGSLFVEVGNTSDSYGEWAGYSGAISSGTWFHWAVVYDGAGGSDADRLKLYINGNMTPIVLSFTGSIPATTSSSLAGMNSRMSKSGTAFDGYMDEMRIWNTSRSAGNINAYYNKIISGLTGNLKAYWRMNEGSGSMSYDETTSGYNATLFDCLWALHPNLFDSDGDGIVDDNDDYPLDATRAFNNFFPAADTGTLVFEDIWPCYGDYDFNDLVMGYQFKTVTNASNEVVEIFGTFITRANGATLINGFGFELPAADAGVLSNVDVSGYSNTQGFINLDGTTHLETGQTNPVVIVVDKINDLLTSYSNTDPAWPYVSPVTTIVQIDVTGGGPFLASDFSLETWNPFLFIDEKRDYELHMFDYAPTDLVDTYYYGLCDDRSVPLSNEYYRNETHLPWALDFPVRFEYPEETVDIRDTYLHFVEWAESDKVLFPDWYSNTAAGYRNDANIYEVP